MAETVVMASGVSAKTGEAPDPRYVFDLWAYDEMTLSLTLLMLNSEDAEAWVAVTLETSMDSGPKARWQALGAFSPMIEGGTDVRRFSGFLRYVRWQLMSNAEAAVVFDLRGMAR